MKVTAIVEVNASLPDSEVKRVAIATLLKVYTNWKESYVITDHKVMDRVERCTTHDWIDFEYVRDATTEDKFIYNTILNIRKFN